MLICNFLYTGGSSISGLVQPEGQEKLVICNNYIKKVILADLKWNKHECLMDLCIMLPFPIELFLRNWASENL